MIPAMKQCSFSTLLAALFLAFGCAAYATAPVVSTVLKRTDAAHFTLRDGTQIVGKLEIKNVEVVTVYGTLTVPLDDLVKIRIGKKSDRELKVRIDKLVTDLGSKDFATRDAATVELGKLGRMAYTELRKASFSDDQEVKGFKL